MQGRHIALQAAVGLDGHKAALGAQALALGRDDVDVVGVLIGFASAACAGRKGNQIKPGVTFQQRSKALADHTGCTDNTNIVLFHPD